MSTNRYDFHFPSNVSSQSNARLLYVSSAKYGGDWHSNPHTHYCSEFFYVTEGVGQFQIEDKIYPVSANDLVIVNPNVLHTELSLNSNPLKYIVLGIEGLELSVTEEQDNSHFCIINFKSVRNTILFHLQYMLEEIETKAPGYEIVCHDLMEIFTVLVSRQTNFSAALTPIAKKGSRMCASVKRHIDNHYRENLSLDSLAEVAHVSKYHMVHAFTQEYGVSPISYMNSKRIQEGRKLLETTDFSLSLISRMLGFSSPSYFSQTFKRQENCAPLEYRKQSRLTASSQET